MRIALPVFSDTGFKNYFDALSALGVEGVIVDAGCDPADFGGLLLPGGGDVDPVRYGEAMSPLCDPPDAALDALQLDTLDAFVQEGKPVLGICRGIQVINVYFGGTLVQHLPQSPRHSRMGGDVDKVHAVRVAGDSFLEKLYGAEFAVNSSHHQAVKAPGRGLRVVAVSDDDVIEAVWHESLSVWGVQWHPERMGFHHPRTDTVNGEALMRRFVELCREG